MSKRLPALAIAGVILLAACSDQSPTTAPRAIPLAPSRSIDANVVCTGATMPVAECEALVELYNTTDGPNWNTFPGWAASGNNPCLWTGVLCSLGVQGWPISLVLTNKGLTGNLPASIVNLTGLRELDFMGNNLTGTIPASLANITGLKTLVLRDNALTGPIPAELGTLASLDTLNLEYNNLTGGIPASLGGLAKLSVLHLGANNLTGSIPSALGNLTNLVDLNLSFNQLTGSIPSQLGNLSKLRRLYVTSNSVSGQIPSTLGNLTNLVALGLDNTALSGPIPASLAQLTKLEYMYLDNDQLSGAIPLSVAAVAESIHMILAQQCRLTPNPDLYVPDVAAYRAVDLDADGYICDLRIASAADIGEDAVDDIDDLVPDVLNAGQANALKTKIQNAVEKAANGQYGAAINQMQAFLSQLNDMVANGTLTPAQAAPFIEQAQWLIAIWTGML